MATYGLRMHHMPIWRKIMEMLQPFLPVPPFSHNDRLADWALCPSGLNIHPVPLCKLTSIITYRLLQLRSWIHTYANNLWHLQKSLTSWTKTMHALWKIKLPLKQRLFLWRCMMYDRHFACRCYTGEREDCYNHGFLSSMFNICRDSTTLSMVLPMF